MNEAGNTGAVMSDDIQLAVDQGVLVATINRPTKKNALTREMYASLAAAVSRADEDAGIGALLLIGSGGNFTSGNDIGLFVQGAEGEHRESPASPFIRNVAALRKPMVACVQGHAVGIGATVLLHCDYVLASDDARIRFPFVYLGLCPEFASTLLLAQVVGRNKATEWLLLGAPIPAAEAHLAGLVNRVVAGDRAREEALSVARSLAAKPRQALMATRGLIREASDEQVRARLAKESAVLDELRRSDEAQAIFRRFLERSTRS